MVRVIRCLDGMAFAIALQVVILVHPFAARDPLGRLSALFVIPAVLLAWFSFRLPSHFEDLGKWPVRVNKLRVNALLTAGLSPFPVWWLITPESGFLLVNSLLYYATGITLLYNLNTVLQLLAETSGDRVVDQVCSALKHVLMYFVFCTYGAFSVLLGGRLISFVQDIGLAGSPLDTLEMLQYTNVVRLLFYLWMVVVVIAGVVLPIRLNRTLASHVHCNLTDPPCPPPPS